MDSFLDEPRSSPKPVSIIQEIETPVVPEVSLMFQNARKDKTSRINLGKPTQSYNAWKLRSSVNNTEEFDSIFAPNSHNKENTQHFPYVFSEKSPVSTERSLLSKKQVRFESPVNSKISDTSKAPLSDQNNKILCTSKLKNPLSNNMIRKPKEIYPSSLTKTSEPYFKTSQPFNTAQLISSEFKSPQVINATPIINANMMKLNTPLSSSSSKFEKLYISNIPNRELDLSFLEPEKAPINFSRGKSYIPPYTQINRGESIGGTSYRDSHIKQMLNTVRATEINHVFTNKSAENCTESSSILNSVNNSSDLVGNNSDSVNNNSNNAESTNNVPNSGTSNSDAVTSSSSLNLEELGPKNGEAPKGGDIPVQNPTESVAEPEKTPNEITSVNDLLQIIKLQNEQLQLLKSQVEKLVELNEKSAKEGCKHSLQPDKDTSAASSSGLSKEISDNKQPLRRTKSSKKEANFQSGEKPVKNAKENEEAGQKVSVGLMTSFEFCFDTPVSLNPLKGRNRRRPRLKRPNHPPAHIRELAEEEEENDTVAPTSAPNFVKSGGRLSPQNSFCEQFQRKRRQREPQNLRYQRNAAREAQHRAPAWNFQRTNETEYSLGSDETLEIREPPESPETSIHIDMQEYDTTDSDDESSSLDNGWTFYKDILGQVNHILEQTPPGYIQKQDKRSGKSTQAATESTDTTLDNIRYAAIKQLQNQGFIQPKNAPFKPNEISFAVKQILMKYLPDDGLAGAASRNNTAPRPRHDERLKSKPTDVSVATFKYLQQYNVVTNPPQFYGCTGKANLATNKPTQNKLRPPGEDPKILDITTLKQQPKLL